MIKSFFKHIIVSLLQWEARLVLKKYKPKIIGITGSVGKTSTKDAIFEVLRSSISVGKSDKSYNSADFGVALTVLGCQSAWYSLFGWIDILIHGLSLFLFTKPYPKWLVLEIGLEHPGDIKKIIKWVNFDMAVITYLPDVPVHVEFFKSKDEVIEEKMLLAKAVPTEGKVFINADDKNAAGLMDGIKAEVLTYGLDPKADYAACEQRIFYEEQDGILRPKGLAFKLEHNGKSLDVQINGVIGEHQIYPILAALAVGDTMSIEMIPMIESVALYMPPPGRLRLIEGIKDTIILDDSYNASPAAMRAGLEALANLEVKGRRIAALADMLQLGGFTPDAHRSIGNLCAEICDMVVTVGLRTKFIDEALTEKKFAVSKIKHFDDSLAAGQYLQNAIKKGDVIFVKGSQSMRMEKVVEEIMAHPEDRTKLLCRQEKAWQ